MATASLILCASRRLAALLSNVRNMSTKSVALVYSDYGDPIKVITKQEQEIESPVGSEVLFKMLASPVNPADINTIQGKYPVKPPLPAIAGNEGVGEVLEVGEAVKNVSIGDHVVVIKNSSGTWRTHAKLQEKDLMKVPKELSLGAAATLTVNPCTAYRMLKDFRTLKSGDTVIQNGSNSACGQNIIQLCKEWKVNTVNVVRNRPDIEELKSYLTRMGATYVFTEEEIRTTDVFKTGKLKRPVLALNCVGGKSALEILRQLDHSGAMVTYGGMSREPVTVPTASLIFKNITLYGYWMTEWVKRNPDCDERYNMSNDLIHLMLLDKLKVPTHQFVKFDQYKNALMNTLSVQGFAGKKFILDFEQ